MDTGLTESRTSPFLTVVTRCHNVDALLRTNVESMDDQSDQDFQHLLIWDRAKDRSIKRANQTFFRMKGLVKGQWVYILDDDDYLTESGFIEGLKEIVQEHDPQVIMVKALISKKKRAILPEPWNGGPPVFCKVSSLNFVVKADLWKRNIGHFGAEGAGDFHFLTAVWKTVDLRVHWWNKLVACAPRPGRDGV